MGLKNISLATFRDFLRFKGLYIISIEGGHEKWNKSGLKRPAILQTHKNPVPEFIIRNNLSTIGSNRREFEDWLKTKS